jgi:hypothetical protein
VTQAATVLGAPPGAPAVRLLNATERDLDDADLRAWAREETAGAPYSSRSYRYPYALVARHTAPVGVDLEEVQPFDPAFAESILTPSERRLLRADLDLADLWCSKEALAKALGDALSYDPRRLQSPAHWPQARSGPWNAAPLVVPGGYRGWLCWREPSTISDGPC